MWRLASEALSDVDEMPDILTAEHCPASRGEIH